jgi:uncharacterized protein (UPF0276 family)
MSNNDKDKPIPASAGIGLRSIHYQHVIDKKPDIAWFEVHAENFFAQGGMPIYVLEKVREDYPLSIHGVGLSLGTEGELNENHLIKLKSLVDRFNPGLISEHISWSAVDGIFLNDLLPLPYTSMSAQNLIRNIQKTQEFLGRQILVENPSTYLEFNDSEMSEPEFINQVIKQSGCGLLLDVNNIYVSAINHSFDAYDYLQSFSADCIGEIHLAGHAIKEISGKTILIDHHGDYISNEVWQLYKAAITRFGSVPTLIEWDTEIPEFDVLKNEAEKAQGIISATISVIPVQTGITN